MACSHSPKPGYAFCGECGQPSDGPRCPCGFVGVMGERFCGRCGRDFRSEGAGLMNAAGSAPARPFPNLPDLARLVAQAAADQGLAVPERKTRLDQDDIRKMIRRRRGGKP